MARRPFKRIYTEIKALENLKKKDLLSKKGKDKLKKLKAKVKKGEYK